MDNLILNGEMDAEGKMSIYSISKMVKKCYWENRRRTMDTCLWKRKNIVWKEETDRTDGTRNSSKALGKGH